MKPFLTYVLIAALYWIVPTRVLSGEDQHLNVYPARVLGVVSAVLAGVHWSLFLRMGTSVVRWPADGQLKADDPSV